LPWLGPGRPAPAPWATAAASRADGFGSQEKIMSEEGRGTAGEGRGSREIGGWRETAWERRPRRRVGERGHEGGQLPERADMLWGVQQFCEEVCVGFVLVSRKFLSFCKIKTTHLEMVKNHETF
jgi:hypothetical protein